MTCGSAATSRSRCCVPTWPATTRSRCGSAARRRTPPSLNHPAIVAVYDTGEERGADRRDAAVHRHGVRQRPHPQGGARRRGPADAPPRAGDHRRHLRRAGVQPPARHHPPRHQARQRDADPERPGQGHGLRHRPGAGQRRDHHDADLARSSARRSTSRRSRRAARRSTPAPTSTPPAACSSSCSADTRRSSATARSAWPTSTSGRTRSAPSEINRDVPPPIDAIVLKALAKNPLNRYQSAGEMRADVLRAAAGRPVLATPVMRDPDDHADGAAATVVHRGTGQPTRTPPARVGDAAPPPGVRLGDRRAGRPRRARRRRAGRRPDRWQPARRTRSRCRTCSGMTSSEAAAPRSARPA